MVGAAVFVLKNPGGIFVLEDAAAGDGLDAAVAAGGGASARADVFDGFAGIVVCGGRDGRNEKTRAEKKREARKMVEAKQHEVR